MDVSGVMDWQISIVPWKIVTRLVCYGFGHTLEAGKISSAL